jgi:hypothetical protein
MPVLAMKGEETCAAATYADTHATTKDTFILTWLIRNAGDNCKGAGAAILCHLIRNSKNSNGVFSPMKILLANQFVESYFESFGCYQGQFPYFECKDQNPEKCEQYSDEIFIPNGPSLQNLRRFFRPEAYAAPKTPV